MKLTYIHPQPYKCPSRPTPSDTYPQRERLIPGIIQATSRFLLGGGSGLDVEELGHPVDEPGNLQVHRQPLLGAGEVKVSTDRADGPRHAHNQRGFVQGLPGPEDGEVHLDRMLARVPGASTDDDVAEGLVHVAGGVQEDLLAHPHHLEDVGGMQLDHVARQDHPDIHLRCPVIWVDPPGTADQQLEKGGRRLEHRRGPDVGHELLKGQSRDLLGEKAGLESLHDAAIVVWRGGHGVVFWCWCGDEAVFIGYLFGNTCIMACVLLVFSCV